MNIYGKAMTDTKRRAHTKVVAMLLNIGETMECRTTSAGSGLLEVNGGLWSAR